MRLLGAHIVLTPAVYKGSGMLTKARELAAHLDGYLVSQFDNPSNAKAHERTTAREILDAFRDNPLDYFVTGAGTGGTLRGVSTRLRKDSPSTRIVVCEPDNSPVLASGRPQPGDGSSHPDFRPHLMQGWSPDFIPALTADAIADGVVDRIVPVAGEAALEAAHGLARKEGILAGITAGATLAGALQVCASAEPGSSVLVMLPDSAERYLSTALFDGIADDMNDAEWALSRATPFARFDRPSPAVPATAPAPMPIDAESEAELENLLSDRENPVVVFALTWCEYCGSLRKLLKQSDIPFRSIDLDAPSMQEQDRGGRLRRALQARTGMPSIPQVFIGGAFVGGCSDTMTAHQDGSLSALLEKAGMGGISLKPFMPSDILPQWRQPGSQT
jgi:cysteine synthase A